MKAVKIYISGKVSPDSVFGTHDWREGFCRELSKKSGLEVINLDPVKVEAEKNMDQKDSKLIFGKDCWLIKQADLVVVNLTDDISVGGSQEMLIAKYYKKPLVGISPKDGKFNRTEKEILGKVYKDWLHPFVSVPCDKIVEDVDGLADFVKRFFPNKDIHIKTISIIDEALDYYIEKSVKH